MKRLHEAAAYGPLADGGNIWRQHLKDLPEQPALTDTRTCDIAIIGAGFTGLNAALRLATDYGAKVAILEAQRIGWGASGRNGGFCCLGGAKAKPSTLRKRYGAKELATFHDTEKAGVAHVDALIETHGWQVDRHSDGETLLAHHPREVPALRAGVAEAQKAYDVKASFLDRAEMGEQGFSSPAFHAALTIPLGFALNPGKYSAALARAVLEAGVEIFETSPALNIRETAAGVSIKTPQGELRAKTLIIATNGYSSEDVPPAMAGRYLPVPSAILTTRPLSEDEIAAQGWSSAQMCYDTRHLLHYFRLMPDRRMLFGMRGATRTTAATLSRARANARRDFEQMFPEWSHVETPHFWAGFLAFTLRLAPFVGHLDNSRNILAGFGFHGNGVAAASYGGACLADMATGNPPHGPLPDFYRKTPRRFPFGRWRRWSLPLAYQWYRFQDR